MSTLINHANYQPQPRDMLMALQKLADLVKQQTGKTPDIFVGASKLYPPKDGQPMDKKAAVAAHEALYGGKGTLIVKDNKVPVFKQVNGAINKDDLGLKQKMDPIQVNAAREKYQALLDKHPSSESFPTINYDDRLALPIVEQKMADNMVREMAVEENLSLEEFTEVLAQGSGYVNTNLDNKVGDGPQISEGLQYLAQASTQYGQSILPKAESTLLAAKESDQKSLFNDSNSTIIPVSPDTPHWEPEPVPTISTSPLDFEQWKDDFQMPDVVESVDQTIAQLTAKIEALQGEVASMKKTMTKIASQEPIPFLKAWAKNKIDTAITNIQDRAKVDMVKTVGFGRDLAQKAMDKISSTTGLFEQSQLNIGGIAKDLKTMFEFHDNPPVIELGDYTYTNNDDGIITVNHKDRGDVFVVDEDRTPKIGAKFNAADYQQLSGVKEAVAVVAGPAAIAAQVVKDLAVGAVKDSAQKSAVKL
jgi:hypothetical protein